jgi:preprotein translocase subunit SecG
MVILITTIHILACLFLIIVVLLQHGKSADIAAAFGGMGSQTAFGPRGAATLLTKVTTACAIIFMLTSITLAVVSSRAGHTAGSVLSGEKGTQSQPAAPAKQPPAPTTPAPK